MTIVTKYNYGEKVEHVEDRKVHTISDIKVGTNINGFGQIDSDVWYRLDGTSRWWREDTLFREGEL